MRTELDIRCDERPNAVADNESNLIGIALLGARHDDFRDVGTDKRRSAMWPDSAGIPMAARIGAIQTCANSAKSADVNLPRLRDRP